MNQQRSRRFRAAQEAADKAEEQRESIKLYEAMGHTVSEETRNKKSWDSNAITPGESYFAPRFWRFCSTPQKCKGILANIPL
jgi:5'-3' exoribonuclease 2